MSQPLVSFLKQPLRPRILVVGDVILDRYLWGNVERISPEAPIPLLRVDQRETRLGGAGSVASMLAALGVEVRLCAAIGDDADGVTVKALLREIGIDDSLLIVVNDRPTTVKERLLGRAQSRHPQQMIRVDYEDDRPLGERDARRVAELATAGMRDADLVLISDYNKGICGDASLCSILKEPNRAACRVIVDPVRGGDYRRYAGSYCITPNRIEAALATNLAIETPQDGLAAARQLVDLGIENVVVTLDRDGMAWASREGEEGIFPVRPRQVYDITGAGDMVLSVIGFSIAGGLPFPQAIELANLAGGLEVERLGTAPISRDELLEEISSGYRSSRQKIVSLEQLVSELAIRRRAGQKIVMTNGCFDLLHPGHVATLEDARALGDCLVVGLNSDRSVEQLKGPGRPVLDETSRAQMLAALGCVDYVTIFDDTSVAELVARVRPAILSKSAAYAPHEVVGHEIVASYGGEVRLTPVRGNFSTTNLIQKILSAPDAIS
jgi:D-beta-D-heptose 7-phosphate kinase/D-beta-D-heptose 1-phosphate adenosyltransferase